MLVPIALYIVTQEQIQILWGLKLIQFLGPSTKLDMKSNIYLGTLPGPWKRHMQVRGPEA